MSALTQMAARLKAGHGQSLAEVRDLLVQKPCSRRQPSVRSLCGWPM